MGVFQPIIRGIQNVGAVQVQYRYNKLDASGKYYLPVSTSKITISDGTKAIDEIPCNDYINVSGFRLDSEFMRAVQQIASSVVIPILGGGGVALTNNNRTGSLSLTCAKVSTPDGGDTEAPGKMYGDEGSGIGIEVTTPAYYDMVLLAQIQQSQDGGDSCGANIKVIFEFCNTTTTVTFQGCTVASVDPLGLSGNDAVNYTVVFNYLNWKVEFSKPVHTNGAGTGQD